MKREPAVLLILAVIITFTAASCCLFGSGKTDDSRTITPSAYRMAVINFELQDTAGGSATIITVPSSNPVILNLTPGATLTASETTLETVLNDNVGAMTTGRTYDEYIITPLYIEMEFETAFHVPSIADEYGFSIDGSSLDTVRTSLVRFYYNPIDNIWRRDMVIYLENIGDGDVDPLTYPDGWYWMRRALEGSTDDFLIPVSTTHPGTPGYADLYPRV